MQGVEAKVRLRPAVRDDREFLLVLYTSTRSTELEAIGWNEQQIRAFCEMQFNAQCRHYELLNPKANDCIVVIGDKPVGRIKVDRSNNQILLVDFAVLPDYRGQGIGTSLLQRLIEEANSVTKPVRLHALLSSPTIRLYERLGFSRTADDGTYVEMEFSPGRETQKEN